MKAQEQQKPENNPSMDEILQSIRGVINEDSPEEQKAQANNDDVLELTEVAEPSSAVAPSAAAATAPTKEASKDNGAEVNKQPATEEVKPAAAPAAVEAPKDLTTPAVEPKPQVAPQNATPEAIKAPAEAPKADDKATSPAAANPEPNHPQEAKHVEATKVEAAPTVESKADSAAKVEAPNEVKAEMTLQSPVVQEALKEEKPVNTNTEPAEVDSKQKTHLVSDKVASEATSAIKELMTKAFKPHTDGLKFRSGTTVEELVVEAIKPYLSQWLDDNLPSIVKSLVEKEIKKLMPNDV
jgi:cell pole-organizing protein PopZ